MALSSPLTTGLRHGDTQTRHSNVMPQPRTVLCHHGGPLPCGDVLREVRWWRAKSRHTESGARRILKYTTVAIVSLLTIVLWVAIIVAGALFGWWKHPLAAKGDPRAFMHAAIESIEQGGRCNTALVLIENGAISAEYYSSALDSVNPETVFATASMSKWITAWGVLQLVEDGKLDLDKPVEDYLNRWHLPSTKFDNSQVTARRLLSHTAGLTDGLGFADLDIHEPVPSLEQSLRSSRSSAGKLVSIELGMEPGRRWKYSGGGYLILELLVEEISGESFETYIDRTILQRLGMTRSGYNDLLGMSNSAKSYDQEGRPANVYRYASKAATSFHTSASDLTKFVLAQSPMMTEKPLSQVTIDEMRQPNANSMGIPIWGLGTMLYAPTSSGDFVFGHDGANEPAIGSTARFNPNTNDAIIVLVTGNRTLASKLGADWVFWQTGVPDFLSIPGEIKRVIPVLIAGTIFILLVTVLGARRKRSGKVPHNSLRADA